MIGRRLVNGSETAGIAPDDRGLQYGDGLFETMAATGGHVAHLALHLARLDEGCRTAQDSDASPRPASRRVRAVLEGMGNGVREAHDHSRARARAGTGPRPNRRSRASSHRPRHARAVTRWRRWSSACAKRGLA